MQDSKNLILAIVLCLVILFGWGRLAEYMGWVQTPDPAAVAQQQEAVRQEAVKAEQRKEEAAKAATLPAFTPAPGRDLTVDSPLYEAVFYTGGGPLRSFKLKKFQTGLAPDSPLVNMVDERTAAVAPLGLVINSQPSWSTGQWSLDSGEQNLKLDAGQQGALRLVGVVDNLRVIRELTFNADSYLIKEKIRLINAGDQPRSVRVSYTVASDASNAAGGRYDSMRVAWDNDGSLSEESSSKTLESTGVQATGKIYWAGAMSTYFLSAVLPGETNNVTVKGLLQKTVYRTAVEEPENLLAPGQEKELTVSYWLGPKDRTQLLAVSDQLAKSIDLGMFSIIAKGLLWLLEFFHKYVHNWGVAIILLTIVIKAVFWPLTAKSYASMEKMKKLQPMMTAIREKYKDNKELMNKEVMALYKTYGVNPASGCVPILIQLPVFFGLYQALLTSIELRHAPFIMYLPFTDKLWLADLSAKDPYYITPVIMGLTMFLQQRMSPPATDPTQQKIMMFLPLIFTVLFLGFPSGLVIYWLVNNILSIFQQWLMMRKNKAAARAEA
ncbi:YidC/Oxa1 family membrane protein insertase [Desulfovibrio sp. 3_1_syn3]|uniref:membrane protein insertase YidC n=1 Tax=Desulfovibrio sp. 3_1_syn3 TaxID=457398 RepID=UPI0001E1266D|nr:membrane protein insertase YidC [Desulfovibrio sp. 3_1_syn3]EFL86362.1 YidC/Oxa1 family membrane protein insertase [Desulfovibrio sp. 3_1_syn3]